MVIHRPTRMHLLAISAAGITALVALFVGATLMFAANVVIALGLAQSYHWSRRHPAAEVDPRLVRLRGRTLEVDLDASSIKGWQRDGKAVRIAISGGGVARFGPFWLAGPSRELERALEHTFPDRC